VGKIYVVAAVMLRLRQQQKLPGNSMCVLKNENGYRL
jgi:hypothetical protein